MNTMISIKIIEDRVSFVLWIYAMITGITTCIIEQSIVQFMLLHGYVIIFLFYSSCVCILIS